MADDDTCGLDETARKKVQVLDVRERNGRIFHITDGFIEAKNCGERKYRLGRTLYEDAAAYRRAYRFRVGS